jgi:hypothetical protein
MSRKQPQQAENNDPVAAIYHRIYAHENFETAAQTLFQLGPVDVVGPCRITA